MMQNFWGDLWYGLRSLRRQPLFTCLAVLTLALGIGANTAVFSVVDAVLLRPLPYPQPEQLVALRERMPDFPNGSVAYLNYLDWRAGQKGFTDLALLRRNSFSISSPGGEEAPERVSGAEVSANFLEVLALRPTLGRNFTAAEDAPDGPKAVLIGQALWKRRFAASPSALGQRLMLDGVLREIVGVLPAEARFPRNPDLLVPLGDLRADPGNLSRGNHQGFMMLGRLKPGMSMKLAVENLDAIAAELERLYPDSNTGRRINAKNLLEYSVGEYRHSLYLLLGAVGCVLLIACANVANLQLIRATARARELAVRAALGASRWRLARGALTEGALLGLIGGAAGVLCAMWALDAIIALSPENVVRFRETKLDWVALTFTGAVALGSGLLVGLWPAWRVSSMATLAGLLHETGGRSGTGGLGQNRARSALVVAQVALAVVLLVSAGLTLKSFWRAQTAPLGFHPEGIWFGNVELPDARYKPKEKRIAFYTQLLERLSSLPNVAAAATGINVPFDENEWDSSFHLTGTPPYPPGREPSAEMNFVSTDYFKVIGLPILRGHNFDGSELLGQPRSVIIDESFAKKFFPGQDPIGKHIDDNQTMDENPPPLTVIGVVPTTRNQEPGDTVMQSMTQMHLALTQTGISGQAIMIRVKSGDPLALTDTVRREVQALDPALPLSNVSTMERMVDASLAPQRLTMTLLAAFGALALVLASIGLYGVMALSVSQRTRELGIRLALGASRAHIFALVLRQGLKLVLAGLALGLLVSLATGQALRSLLYNVGALDLQALLIATGTLAATAFVACWLPARRATNVDPLVALRQE